MSIDTGHVENESIAAAQNIKERDYWLRKLSGECAKSSFPYDFRPAAIGNPARETQHFSFPPDLLQVLNRLSNGSDIRMFIILVSGLVTLLYKYSYEESGHVMVGAPIYKQEIEGQFINTVLALKLQPQKHMTFKDMLLHTAKTLSEAAEHQNYPIERLVYQLNLPVSEGEFPLFDIAVCFDNLHDKTYLQQTPTAMTFVFSGGEDHLEGRIEYDSMRYEQGTVERIAGYLVGLIRTAAGNLETVLEDLIIPSAGEDSHLLQALNREDVEYPGAQSIQSLFAAQVEKQPQATALAFEKDTMTYGQLNRKVEDIAAMLKTRGIGPSRIVALLLEPSFHMMAGLLGILRAGCAYLPLDGEYPPDRLTFMLEDSRADVLLTVSGTELPRALSKDTPAQAEIIHIDRLQETTEKTSPAVPPLPIDAAKAPAYIIYTSGTTGKPKGVMIPNRAVVRLLENQSFPFDFHAGDTWTMFHSYCFDFSVWEMYGALLKGGKLVMVPKMTARDPQAFRQLAVQHGVTVLNQTPSAFYNFINQEMAQTEKQLKLRYVIFGGESLAPGKLKEWKKRYPGTKLVNMFGITETTVHVTIKELTGYEIDHNINNVGLPIPTLSAYILDSRLKPRPVGVPGQLYVGGSGVASGYLNRPQLTSEKFIPNPFNPGRILYASGDLARLNSRGELIYMGRMDQQVQLRGFRIEPGEIENQLLKIEGVKASVVITGIDRAGDDYICAYLAADTPIPLARIRNSLSHSLPLYMVPKYFVFLDRIPLTSNGKVDKQALPEPEVSSEDEYIAPVTETEKAAAGIWAEILDLERVGVKDNYFNIGGDSIKAVKLLGALNDALDTDLSIPDLYQNETIEKLVIRIEELSAAGAAARHGEETAKAVKAVENLKQEVARKYQIPAGIEDFYPMSDIEKGMVFASLLNPEEAVYHDQFVFQLKLPGLQPDIFQQAFELCIEKHSILRTSFDIENYNENLQFVHKNISPQIHHFDISGKERSEQESYLADILNTGRKTPFVLSSPPLWRMSTFKTGPESVLLIWEFHHAILDGWSNACLMSELTDTYIKLKTSPDYRLSPLKKSYKDFVIEQTAWKMGGDAPGFWKTELAEYQKLDLSRLTAPDAAGAGRKDYGYEIAPQLHRQLQQTARRRHTSVKHLLFGAYARLIDVLFGGGDIVIGLVTNNRPISDEGDQILGCFLNSIPVRLNVPNGMTYGEYVGLIEKKLVELKQYEKLSLFEISRLVGEKGSERNPIFNILYNYVDYHVYDRDALEDVGYRWEREREIEVSGHESSGFSWGLNVSATFGKLTADFSYDAAVIGNGTIRGWAGYFDAILRMIVRDGVVMKTDDLLNQEEKRQLLETFNHTGAPRPDNAAVHDLFRRQAEETPDRRALIFEGTPFTYRQLDNLSDRLAGLLNSRGIGMNDIVALLVETSRETAAGILGILKSGAAYLPISPADPQERLKYILRDSRASAVVTAGPGVNGLEGILDEITATPGRPEILYFPRDEPSEEHTPPPVTGLSPAAPAYAVYTSGTTGRPKGVLVEHRGVVNYSLWRISAYEMTEEDVTLQLLSYSFDGFVSNFYTALLSGGTLVLAPDDKKTDYRYIAGLVKEHGVTNTSLVPGMYEALLDNAGDGDTASLRFIVLAGETAGERLMSRSRAINPALRHFIEYGPTEATVTATANLELRPGETSVIGAPIANAAVYILDKDSRPVPIGVPGEIAIGGMGVSRGYLNRPEQTAALFGPNPFPGAHTMPGRLYRTGDTAKWLPGGRIQFIGRNDLQVKVRGFRIELKEIERKLLEHPRINEVIVAAPKNKEGERYLCAYIVLTEQPETEGRRNFLPAGKLRRFLSSLLPKYMIPSFFIQLETIPLTRNGKVDLKALPVPETVTASGSVPTENTPADEMQKKIEKIWIELLGLEETAIGLDTSFFDIGGHSLKATTLASRLHKEFGVIFPVSEVFKSPSLRGLSQYIKTAPPDTTESNHKTTNTPDIEPVEKREYYLMSSAQERLYFLYQMAPDSVGYNMPRILLVEGDMQLERMEKAMKALLQRHEILRTSFQFIDNIPRQRVYETAPFEIDYFDAQAAGMSENGDGTPHPEVGKRIGEFIRPFDPVRPPLLRMGLVKRAEEKFVWMIDLHHIISDKVTQEILITEFLALYDGKEPAPLSLQYKDYSEWQKRIEHSPVMEAQAAYWTGQFEDGIPRLELPSDYPRPALMTLAGDMVLTALDEEQNRKINQFTHKTGTTLYMLMLAVFNVLMSKSSGQEDLVVGSPIAGRGNIELESIAGVFVNMLALRNQPAKNKTFIEFLSEVKSNALKAYENQDFQFPDLVNKLGLERDQSRNPLFNVVFQSDILSSGDIDFGELKLLPYEGDNSTRSQFDLIMGATGTDGSVFLQLTYSTELFKPGTAQQMLRRYVQILDQVLADGNVKISDITLSHGLMSSRSDILDREREEFGF